MPDQQHLDLARAALLEETPESTIGELLSETAEEDGSITLRFASSLPGYPGWVWTVSLAHLPGSEPTVLEAELMPGDGALLAPDWVPWADRLAEYKAAQDAAEAEAAAAAAESGEDAADEAGASAADDDDLDDDSEEDDLQDDEDEDLDDDSDEDDDEDDLLGSDVLHSGDLDGVDIDALDVDDDLDDESDEDDYESEDDEDD